MKWVIKAHEEVVMEVICSFRRETDIFMKLKMTLLHNSDSDGATGKKHK